MSDPMSLAWCPGTMRATVFTEDQHGRGGASVRTALGLRVRGPYGYPHITTAALHLELDPVEVSLTMVDEGFFAWVSNWPARTCMVLEFWESADAEVDPDTGELGDPGTQWAHRMFPRATLCHHARWRSAWGEGNGLRWQVQPIPPAPECSPAVRSHQPMLTTRLEDSDAVPRTEHLGWTRPHPAR